MKKITFTPKAKKITAITSAAVVCVCVLTAALSQHTNTVDRTSSTTSSLSSSEISISVAPASGTKVESVSHGVAGTGKAWIPAKGKKSSVPLTITSKPSSKPSKPTISGDSKNGKQPTNGTLTNRSERPTYKTPPKAPATHHSSYSEGTTAQRRRSNGGTTTRRKSNGGQQCSGYDPIFGNKRGTAHGEQTTIGNANDNFGKTIGIMD